MKAKSKGNKVNEKKDSQPKPRRIIGLHSLKGIQELLANSPYLTSDPPYSYRLSLLVITYILNESFNPSAPNTFQNRYDGRGSNWVRDHILKGNQKSPFLRAGSNNHTDLNIHTLRVIELAELLYNLQTVPGISNIYRRLVTDPTKLESTILELQGLKWIWLAKLGLRVVHKGAGQGLNYECEILLPNGEIAYCEMKCKLEGAEFSESSIKSTISKARKQLPKGKCGIVILKIPVNWIPDKYSEFEGIIRKILKSTTRITAVICYWQRFQRDGKYNHNVDCIKEYYNENSSHLKSLDYGLVEQRIILFGISGWFQFFKLNGNRLKRILEVELKDSTAKKSKQSIKAIQ